MGRRKKEQPTGEGFNIPPSLAEVKGYIERNGYSVDPKHFIDYYTANNWLLSKHKGKMQDWCAAVRVWEVKEVEKKNNNKQNPNNNGHTNKCETGGGVRETALGSRGQVGQSGRGGESETDYSDYLK